MSAPLGNSKYVEKNTKANVQKEKKEQNNVNSDNKDKIDKTESKEKDKEKPSEKNHTRGEKRFFSFPKRERTTIKESREQSTSEQSLLTLWIRLHGEEFDPIPIPEIPDSITVHDLKKILVEHEEFEICGARLHRTKLYCDGIPLDPKSTLNGLDVEDGAEIEIRISAPPIVTNSPAPRHDDTGVVFTPRVSEDGNAVKEVLKEQEIISKELKKQIKELKRLSSTESPTTGGTTDKLVSQLKEMEEANVKRYEDILNVISPRHRKPHAALVSPINDGLVVRGIPVSKPKVTQTTNGHTQKINCLACTDELLISGSDDSCVKVWDVNSMKVKHSFNGHTAAVSALALMKDGEDNTIIASASLDYSVKFWDIASNKMINSLEASDAIHSLYIYRNTVLTGHQKVAAVWDIKKNKMAKELDGHDHYIRAILVADGMVFTAARVIKLWDAGNFVPIGEIDQHTLGSTYCLGFWEPKKLLLCGTYERCLTAYDTRQKERAQVVSSVRHNGCVYSMALQGDRLFTGCYDNHVYEWDMRKLDQPQSLKPTRVYVINEESSQMTVGGAVNALCVNKNFLCSGAQYISTYAINSKQNNV